MNRVLLSCAVSLCVCVAAEAAVTSKKITYKHGDVSCVGYLAWDDAVEGPRPGVLVVHEWWGLDEYARKRADQLAGLGYVAFAADMYGEGKVAEHAKDAGEMAGKVRANLKAWRGRAQAGLDVLQAQPQCDKSRCAAIGYCFGGSTALQLAFSGANVKAVVSFHGALPAPSVDDVKNAKAAILVCHGAADTFIPETAIKAFRGALDRGSVKYDFVAYDGVKHSFTVPDADKRGNPGMKYDKHADEDSWKRMKELFAEKLK